MSVPDITAWLQRLGLERFAPIFQENEIDMGTLPHLTENDLEKMGIKAIGPQKKILAACKELCSPSSMAMHSVSPASMTPPTPISAPSSVLTSAPPPPPSSDSLDWQINLTELHCEEREIGRGGFGAVYRGIYRGQLVAVKQLLRTSLDSAELRLFSREISILRRLHSPYIVQFIGAHFAPPRFCILMEYMSRGSLRSVLASNTMPQDKRLPALLDIAKGMMYLHGQAEPVLHRDLSSLNILVDDHWHCKVSDFGMSRAMKETESTMTAQPGNMRWMAPEVASGTQHYGKSADVFSFGLIIYDVFHNAMPFSELQPLQAAMKYSQGERPPITARMPSQMVQLMLECLTHDPAQRPAFPAIVERIERAMTEGDGEGYVLLNRQTPATAPVGPAMPPPPPIVAAGAPPAVPATTPAFLPGALPAYPPPMGAAVAHAGVPGAFPMTAPPPYAGGAVPQAPSAPLMSRPPGAGFAAHAPPPVSVPVAAAAPPAPLGTPGPGPAAVRPASGERAAAVVLDPAAAARLGLPRFTARKFAQHKGYCLCVRYEPLLQRLMCARPGDHVVEIYDTETAVRLGDLPAPARKYIRALHFDRALCVTAAADRCIRVYDVVARELLHTWNDAQDEVNGLDVHGAVMFAAADDRLVYQYDLRTRSLVRRLSGHTGGVYVAQFDGRAGLLSGGTDGLLCLWDIRRPAAPVASVPHPKTVKSLMFDNYAVVTACYDDVLRLYDVHSLTAAAPEPIWQRPVRETIHAVALCGDVVFHGANQRLCITARSDGTMVDAYESLHDNAVYAIDARWPGSGLSGVPGVATAAFDGVVALWTQAP